MPFKLKLKKSKHYSVVSKSLFVISVEILDGTTIECTLSSESTGQDCLEIVCQKLNLNQPKFFGLQYNSCHNDNNCYWLELDRPIKRQLDKYARSLLVYLRVMFYVISGVRLITDEVTRYHYFLQLKQDVIDGRISCTHQQAVELASYSMQAEFGDFVAERHTSHYLKDFQLFPKSTEPMLLESLTEAAIRQHAALHNLPQNTAEEYYICACQKLDGYGQEQFNVKAKDGTEMVIALGLTGVSVIYPPKYVRHLDWTDISNVVNHKKEFTFDLIGGLEKADFYFNDIETSKNAWRFCCLQHMFYRQYEMNSNGSDDNQDSKITSVHQHPPTFQQQSDTSIRQMSSYEDVTNWSSSNQNLSQKSQSTSCLDLNKPTDIDRLRDLLPSYRPAPDYETAIQQKYKNSAGELLNSEELANSHAAAAAAAAILYSSQPEIHQMDGYHLPAAAHLRYPDVTHNNIEQKNLLYNSAFTQPQLLGANDNRHVGLLHLYKQPPPYPVNKIGSNSTPDLAGISQPGKLSNYLINSLVSGSSPDLVSGGNIYLKQYNPMYHQHHHQQAHSINRSQSYLPPQQQQHGTYENLASIFKTPHPPPHQGVIVEDPNLTRHIKKVYDEHCNIIYCMPTNMKQILQDNQLSSRGFVVARNQNALQHSTTQQLANSTEPIYENIPLLWQNESGGESSSNRSRTQSIHSAPEVINGHLVSSIQAQLQQMHLPKNNNNNNNNDKENVYMNITKPAVDTTNPNASTGTQDFNISEISNSTAISAMNANNELSITDSTTQSKSNNTLMMSSSSTNDQSSTSDMGTKTTKKKRWGILIGKNKTHADKNTSSKSATIGREKKKDDKNHHRWSTGLPKFNPLPPSISKEQMCQLLENKLGESQLFFEFDKIPKKKQNADFTTALLEENAAFNRFKDVLPYEENRLRLTPSKFNKYGYINASHITATVGSKQRFYIAAQGPTKLTLQYFWQAVWEAEVYLMIQLTDPSEDLTYLPNVDERCIDINKDYQVWWEFSQKSGHCVTSKVRLCHVASRRYRTIWHLHYTEWGEQGCPNLIAHFLGFLEEMHSVHQHSMEEIPPGHNRNPPILVHCTAGVGRTGLTILCDLLLYTVDHNQEVCIPGVLSLLRQQRPLMIQTIAQYRFIYSLLIHYLKQSRLI